MFFRRGASLNCLRPLRCSTQRWCLKKETSLAVHSTRHETEFIVKLKACGSHMMADACTLNAGVKIITGLPGEGRGKFASQEGGELIGLDGLDGRTHDGLIEGLEIGLATDVIFRRANSTCMKLQ